MRRSDITHRRLQTQHLAGAPFASPADVVAWFGAVQAQDYLAALWAIGLRVQNGTEQDVERAIADRTLVRTWPMRGTIHLVPAVDARWMLELLTPRILSAQRGRYRQLELDENVLARCKKVFVKALAGGKQLSRPTLYRLLEAAGVSTTENRGLHILGYWAQKGLVCGGGREGKQQTFALLAEWAPVPRTLLRDEALAEISKRYFISHGPATLRDFVWWSGLTVADARAAIELSQDDLARDAFDGETYWFAPSTSIAKVRPPHVRLLPVYDEYLVGYRDRSAALDPHHAKRAGNGIFSPVILVDGRVAGTWTRAMKRDTLVISAIPFEQLRKSQQRALLAEAQRYSAFVSRPVSVVMS